MSICTIAALCLAASVADEPKPAMNDFIGLNTHTIQFRPDLYRPVAKLIRNYHPVAWDLGDTLTQSATLPKTINGVNWDDLYPKWKQGGYKTLASLMFESIKRENWKDIEKQAYDYGLAFAKFYGPSGTNPAVEAVEIGNEPTEFNDADYRRIFESMAKGLRKGDPKLLIAPCTMAVGSADKYSKDIKGLKGLESLYDILNVHVYAFVEGWPTWRRSYPEDPKIAYLKQVREIIDWRNKNAPGKQVWVTEFGYDSTTQPNLPSGDFAKWVGVTDTQQAQYIVRSFLVFSSMDVDRAYLYWFNDEDKPTLHASSGLTRNYKPKPSFYAVAQMKKNLGSLRFSKALAQKEGGAYVYEFEPLSGKGEKVWVVWSATGSGASTAVSLPLGKSSVSRAESMALAEGSPAKADYQVEGGKLTMSVGESPVYVWVR